MIKEIKNSKEFDEIISKEKLVLADFYASWCGPCKALGPIIDKYCSATNPNITLIKINVDEQLELAAKHNVKSIPHVLLYVDGKVKAQFNGFKAEVQIKEFVETNSKK